MTPNQRVDLFTEIAERLEPRDRTRPFRLGIDGRCGVGKTRFAADLSTALRSFGEDVVSIDSDLFHQPRPIRHRNPDPARGYLADAYDLTGLREHVLAPLALGPASVPVGLRRLEDDAPVSEQVWIPAGAIVVFDATFVQRPELRGHWDLVILLDASQSVALDRSVRRDSQALGGRESALQAHQTRYGAAWRLYEESVDPRAVADVVVDLDDPERPSLVR